MATVDPPHEGVPPHPYPYSEEAHWHRHGLPDTDPNSDFYYSQRSRLDSSASPDTVSASSDVVPNPNDADSLRDLHLRLDPLDPSPLPVPPPREQPHPAVSHAKAVSLSLSPSPSPVSSSHAAVVETFDPKSHETNAHPNSSIPGVGFGLNKQLPPLPSPRAVRSLSLAQLAGPVKRKPLSSAASPTAIRFSLRAGAASTSSPSLPYDPASHVSLPADLPRPELRFARSCSVDSPTLYEFPQRSLPAPSALRVAIPDQDHSEPSSPGSPSFRQQQQQQQQLHHHQDLPVRSPLDSPVHPVQLQQNTAVSSSAASQTSRTPSLVHELGQQSPSDETPSVVHTQDSDQDSDPYELGSVYSDPAEPDAELDSDSPHTSQRVKPATPIEAHTGAIKTMSLFSRKSPPPHLNLQASNLDGQSIASPTSREPNLNKPLPKSPASSKLSAFFGWATSPAPPTTPSDYEEDKAPFSPLPPPSPTSPPKRSGSLAGGEAVQTPITGRSLTFPNVGDQASSLQYCESYLQTPEQSTTSLGQIEEMEDELKAISAELASSIRREMDLEDLVERLQEQLNNPQARDKRSSDYFSDSGYSSAKYSDYDAAKEEISTIQRRAEQEKAQIRLELTQKLQEEREKRRLLDQQIQELSRRASQIDVEQINNAAITQRVKELEAQCEDLSRRLNEERQVKSNFEDLLNALKGELETATNERDNLRDEVIPQLQARVEGLEAEAAEHAKLAYDTTKMQQELEQLRAEQAERERLIADTAKLQKEIEALRAECAEHARRAQEASRLQHELQMLRSENAELKMSASIGSPPPAPPPPHTRMSMGLSRSASVTGSPGLRKDRPQSLARSNTINKPGESREVLAERLKDVEAQRDALHSALKSLLERQELQNRENAKRIRQLEMERDRLLSASPKKAGYEREVAKLRDEINVLRRRAEDAIEQKFQVEKGLIGLKMDLDRAQEEIASLRRLLKEKDILIPNAWDRPSSSHSEEGDEQVHLGVPVTSSSLEKAYQDLQAAYADALKRLKGMEEAAGFDEKMQMAMQRLEQALANAVSDRDLARAEADSYRAQVESLQKAEKEHLEAERDLAEQLEQAARRVEDLAAQVRAQLDANAALRARLAETVARGEVEQKISTERIASMQNRLRALEEQVIAAQTSAEERVARYEEEIARLKEAHSAQLQRLRDVATASARVSSTIAGALSPRLMPPKSPLLSPMFSPRSGRSSPGPRPSSRMSLPGSPAARPTLRRSLTGESPLDMASEVEQLRKRVTELEGQLAVADAEMQQVVERVTQSQMEVFRLQEERDEAMRMTRKLQRCLEEERMRVFEREWRELTQAQGGGLQVRVEADE